MSGQCKACYRYSYSKDLDGYCDNDCRNRVGIAGFGQIKRELSLGELVTDSHMFVDGQRVRQSYSLFGKAYEPRDSSHKIYVIERRPKKEC